MSSLRIALCATVFLASSSSMGAPLITGPVGARAERAGKTAPVRELMQRIPEPWRHVEGLEINKLNTVVERDPVAGVDVVPDAALREASLAGLPVTPGPTATCEGVANADNTALINPPDTTGDVGPDHFVQAVNNRVRIYDKNCTALGAPFTMSDLFDTIGGICSVLDQGDPIVLYDRLADRWLISQFAFASQTTPPWHECIAISETGDPTGAYYAYDFVVPPLPLPPGGGFPDYPKLGVWPDGYYMTTREFNPGFTGHGAFAFERAKMLLGDPTATLIYFHVASSVSNASSGMVPTDHDGILPPPTGAPNMFAIVTDDIFGDPGDALRLFEFTPNYAVPASSTFTERGDSPLAVASFDSRSPTGRTDIEQPAPAVSTTDNLDSIGDRLMPKLFYLNRGGTESWVVAHTVNGGTIPGTPVSPTAAQYRAAVRYYELRRIAFPGPITVNEQSTYSPSTLERWMASVAMNDQGDIAVGYSTSSAAVGDHPSVAWAVRQDGDPTGLGTEAEMFAGSDVQRASGNRWGDYTAMAVDPADDCTFWHTNEYIAGLGPLGNGTFNWQTRIGNFVMPGCVGPAKGTLEGQVTAADTLSGLGGVQVELSGAGPSAGATTTTDASGNYSMQPSPGTYTVTFRNPLLNCSPDIVVPGVVVVDAVTTTQNATIDGTPKLLPFDFTVHDGNSNGVVNRDECNNLELEVLNDGCGNATSLNGVLSTTTPNVTVKAAISDYPDLAIGASDVNSRHYRISTSPGFACGTPIDLSLNIGGGPIGFSIPSCTGGASQQFTGTLTISDPNWTASGRVSRSGSASTCVVPKGFPGVFDSGPRRFDTHSVSNPFAQPVCLTATLTTSCVFATAPIYSTTYLGSFNPANLATNYLADPGLSPNQAGPSTPVTWSFVLPASSTAVFVVNKINNDAVECLDYTLDVSGFFDDTAGPGANACTLTAIFADGFESGDTSMWTATVPP